MSDVTAEWLGVMFNKVGGNATLTDITVTDNHPEASGVFVVRNTIGRNLNCTGLAPGRVRRFLPRQRQRRRRQRTGQCASLV